MLSNGESASHPRVAAARDLYGSNMLKMGTSGLDLGAKSLDLDRLKEGFTSLVSQAEPGILPAFLLWLDLKLSEYKVHGYMFSDPENRREGPWLKYALEVLYKYNGHLNSVNSSLVLEQPALNGAVQTNATDPAPPAGKRNLSKDLDMVVQGIKKESVDPCYGTPPATAAVCKKAKTSHHTSAVTAIDLSMGNSACGEVGYSNGSASSKSNGIPSSASIPLAQSNTSKATDVGQLMSMTMRELLAKPVLSQNSHSQSKAKSCPSKSSMKQLLSKFGDVHDFSNGTRSPKPHRSRHVATLRERERELSTSDHSSSEMLAKEWEESRKDAARSEKVTVIGKEQNDGLPDTSTDYPTKENKVTSALRELLSAKLNLPSSSPPVIQADTMIKKEPNPMECLEALDAPSSPSPTDSPKKSISVVDSDRGTPELSSDAGSLAGSPLKHELDNSKTMMEKLKASSHQCGVCGQIFQYRSSFRRHMKVHQGIFSHVCAVCSRKFTRKEHFIRHKCSRRPNKASRGSGSDLSSTPEGKYPKLEFPPGADQELDDLSQDHMTGSPDSHSETSMDATNFSERSMEFADSPCSATGKTSGLAESRRKSSMPRRVVLVEDEEEVDDCYKVNEDNYAGSVDDHVDDKEPSQKTKSHNAEANAFPIYTDGAGVTRNGEADDEEASLDADGYERVSPNHPEAHMQEEDDLDSDLGSNPGDDDDTAGDNADEKDGRKLSEMFTIDTGSYKVCNEDGNMKVVKQGNYLRLKDEAQIIGDQVCFVCPTCGKIFHRSSNFSRHMRIHRGVYSYVCQTCYRGFFRKEHFQKHNCSRRSMSHIWERKTKIDMAMAEAGDAAGSGSGNESGDAGSEDMYPIGVKNICGDHADEGRGESVESDDDVDCSDDEEPRLTIVTEESSPSQA